MKNEDFKFDRDKIDGEMSEMFAFDPTCGEKAVHDAIKEKMRAEAARKNRSTRNRLIVSTAASLAVVVTAITLLPALFSNKNVDENLGNGFAPGTDLCYESADTEVKEAVLEDILGGDFADGQVVKCFKFLSDEYNKQLGDYDVLVVYKDNESIIFTGVSTMALSVLRSYVKAESEPNDLRDINSDTLTYCPIEEPIEETMISTEATPLEPVEETIAAVYEDAYATESMFVCEFPVEGEDTTYVTSSGNSSIPMEEDVADVVIIYPEGDSIAVWLDDMLINQTGCNLGKFIYFNSSDRYYSENYYEESGMVDIYDELSFSLESDSEYYYIIRGILLKDAQYLPADTGEVSTDTTEASIDTTPVEDIASSKRDFTLYLNGNFENYHILVDSEISNIIGHLSEIYSEGVCIYGKSIFKIGFEYDPETVEYMGITAVDFDENFVVVSLTEFELQSNGEGYCATYDIPEINAGFGRAYFITINAAGEEESILFIDGEATDKLFQ